MLSPSQLEIDQEVFHQLPQEEQNDFIRILEETKRLEAERKIEFYKPYPKQKLFHDLGRTKRERAIRAANQIGKTLAAGCETTYHLTGEYPAWWQGKRFERPTRGIAGSKTGELTRKGVQRILVGEPTDEKQWGTGTIPKDCLLTWSRKAGVPDALDSIVVKHISGGQSVLYFNSYDQGREKWQAETVDFVWFDEEPPEDIYFEGITRTNRVLGPVYLTLTPLLGMSKVVARFMAEESEDRAEVNIVLDDATFYTPEERKRIADSYPEHERDCRTKGIPIMGSGLVFPIAEEEIKVKAFPIPPHWAQIGGLDFGYDHPTAATKLAWDRDTDTIYVTAAYKRRGADIKMDSPTATHASALKPWGDWLPWAWPHDGGKHDPGSGKALANQYREHGLNMLVESNNLSFTFPNGTTGVEAGVLEMLDRMQTGRWKVFEHLIGYFEEMRMYHRKDGRIVLLFDDLISSSRYALMCLRFASVSPRMHRKRKHRRRDGMVV